jgi:transcriptional regulator with PAS, ATPase and Fis domain
MLATGCISIDQEIFLNADGSGDVAVIISLPDLPEKMGGAQITTTKSPTETLAEFKKELTTALPQTIALTEAREVKQNGVQSIYAVFHFKQLDDVQRVLANFGKGSLKESDIGSAPQWSLQIEKKDNKTHYTQRFVIDVDTKAKGEVKTSKPGEKQQTAEGANASNDASNDMEEQFKPLLLSIIRMRFVLHTPSAISDTNADIVLNGKTAVWNCSLAAFSKDKKPIEMKATF